MPSVQSLNLSDCDLMVKIEIIFSEIVSNGYYNQNVKVKVRGQFLWNSENECGNSRKKSPVVTN